MTVCCWLGISYAFDFELPIPSIFLVIPDWINCLYASALPDPDFKYSSKYIRNKSLACQSEALAKDGWEDRMVAGATRRHWHRSKLLLALSWRPNLRTWDTNTVTYFLAPEAGLEPATIALTGRCSTIELLRNML